MMLLFFWILSSQYISMFPKILFISMSLWKKFARPTFITIIILQFLSWIKVPLKNFRKFGIRRRFLNDFKLKLWRIPDFLGMLNYTQIKVEEVLINLASLCGVIKYTVLQLIAKVSMQYFFLNWWLLL